MIGDVLKREICKLKDCSQKKNAPNTFWVVLRDIAAQEIIEHEKEIDSDIIIPIYYEIIRDNIDCIPSFFRECLPSNKQERFRVIIRNLFSSNAFHTDGLANQPGILAYKSVNENKKGERIIYKKKQGGNKC